MQKNQNKSIILIPIVILEFSIILSWVWMMGDFSQIRFGVWPISEWLINYQGGFVRRGFIGEILYQLFPGQALIPKVYQLTFYLYLIYCMIFVCLYRLSKIRDLPLLILMLLIPGGIFHMAISSSFYTRKEILFLILFGLLCFIYLQIKQAQDSKKSTWITIFISLAIVGGVIITLCHEAFIFMSFPYIASLFWLLKKEYPQQKSIHYGFVAFATMIPIVFLLCTMMHGSVLISENIWDSLSLQDRLVISPHSPYTVYGAIGGIGWDKLQNLSTLYGVLVSGGWIIWICFGIVQYLVLGYVFTRGASSHSQDEKLQNLTLISIPFVLSLSIFFIGSDWGRWIASSGNHFLLFSFVLFSQSKRPIFLTKKIHAWPLSWINRPQLIHARWLFWMIIGYELIFKLPECCVQYPYFFIQYSLFAKLLGSI